jgi:hypothetical protein
VGASEELTLCINHYPLDDQVAGFTTVLFMNAWPHLLKAKWNYRSFSLNLETLDVSTVTATIEFSRKMLIKRRESNVHLAECAIRVQYCTSPQSVY